MELGQFLSNYLFVKLIDMIQFRHLHMYMYHQSWQSGRMPDAPEIFLHLNLSITTLES